MNPYIKAARLRTLPLSVSGTLLGSLLAKNNPFFSPLVMGLTILLSLVLQILSNFANDYGDFVKGTDNAQRVGEKRALQTGILTVQNVKTAIYFISLTAIVIAFAIIFITLHNFLIEAFIFIALAFVSIWAAIRYTVGNSAYGYHGFGDLFVFLFFGLLSVCGTHFLQTLSLDYNVFLPAISIGCLSAAVLNLNNMRDMENDKIYNKNTLVVKIGWKAAKYYHLFLILTAVATATIFVTLKFTNLAQFLYLLTLPIFIQNLYKVFTFTQPQDLDKELKKVAIGTLAFAILFGLTNG